MMHDRQLDIYSELNSPGVERFEGVEIKDLQVELLKHMGAIAVIATELHNRLGVPVKVELNNVYRDEQGWTYTPLVGLPSFQVGDDIA